MTPTAPLWSDVAAPAQPRFPGGTQRADVAIVGAGFAGLSAAYHLLARRPGARVVVLEKGQFASGASGRTTGMLGPGVGQALGSLVRRFGPVRARALYCATLRAVEEVCHLIESEDIECELERSAQLLVARSAGMRARVEREARLHEQLELPGQRLDDAALDAALHLHAPPGGRGPAALRLPLAGVLHPTRFLAGLAERVVARGGIIHEGSPVLHVGAGKPVELILQGGTVLADEVVIATAGYTPALGLLRGRILPVHLQVLATEPLDAESLATLGWRGRESVRDARRVFNYFRLTADDRIVFGGGAPRYRWSGDVSENAGAPAALEHLRSELAATFPPGARLRIARAWTGLIGYVLDALPAIQRMPSNPAVLHVVGWCGHGVALSIASGAWVTNLLCDGAAPEDLPWFRADPPLVPFEPVRWLSFQTAVGAMAALDRLS